MDQIKTFVINIESRSDRMIKIREDLEKIGLKFERFNAIHDTKYGRIGLLKTIEKLLQHCIDSDIKEAFILEDDTKFIVPNPIEMFDECRSQLPVDYDLFYLGCNLHQDSIEKYSPNLIKLTKAWACHAILYSETGIVKVLSAVRSELSKIANDPERKEAKNVLPLDTTIIRFVQNDGKCYGSFPMLCTQYPGISSIENRHVDYAKFLEDKFAKKTKHLNGQSDTEG